ncbi:WYL domain-containing protein [Yersinia canariae]|uniref:WYL domain-containing protein n=1 Tax=Yersinia canariae TaxID=2607663 RepID=A0A857EVC7_9GAMM|nr:WYL domain-containing protein [Yersinia canariae]QHB31278.1 WYL domain-containing protein [Yersinia canariae]
MPQPERRYDRLAVRLSLIISRLLSGETLSVRKLAGEFGVSVRTLRRDFRERLMYLDLEYQNGYCRLLPDDNLIRQEKIVMNFARQSGVSTMLPGLNTRLVNTLLSSSVDAPCIIWGVKSQGEIFSDDILYNIIFSITQLRKIKLTTASHLCRIISPYRLVLFKGNWFLVGESFEEISVHRLSELTEVCVLNEKYTPNDEVSQIITNPQFMIALPHFSFIQNVILCFLRGSIN